MFLRLLIIFLPCVIGFIWNDKSEGSIAWSLAGSVFIAGFAQTKWFRQSHENSAFTERLLRPVSMYHLIFVAYNVLGGGAYALDAAGYTIWGKSVISVITDLTVIAECQRMMLLAHASVTAGMKIVGFRYGKPKYVLPPIPPYTLIVVSFLSLGIGTLLSGVSAFNQLSQKILAVSATAISVEILLCIKYKRVNNLILALILMSLNLLQQAVSGWKGAILWTAIMLGAMLYPLMPKRIVFGGIAFVLFWALYFHPFGLALRPQIWSEGVEQSRAVEMSISQALNMSFEERLDNVWDMMVGRANDMYQFVKYVEYVPDKHPFFRFEIVSDSIVAIVPRVLWPDKPDLEKVAMQRVYEAGIVSQQSVVSAKSNYYQDAYLSWGEGAIIVACLFFGIVTMLISRLCERLFDGYQIGTCLIYTSFMATTVNQPPNFEYFVAAVAMAVVLIFAIFALGRGMGWIIPAEKLSQGSKKQTKTPDSMTESFQPRTGKETVSAPLLKPRDSL